LNRSGEKTTSASADSVAVTLPTALAIFRTLLNAALVVVGLVWMVMIVARDAAFELVVVGSLVDD
jgi:hypothetical protein